MWSGWVKKNCRWWASLNTCSLQTPTNVDPFWLFGHCELPCTSEIFKSTPSSRVLKQNIFLCEVLNYNSISAHQCVTALCATCESQSNTEILLAATKQILNLLLNSRKFYTEPIVIIALPSNQIFCFSLIFLVLQVPCPLCCRIKTLNCAGKSTIEKEGKTPQCF